MHTITTLILNNNFSSQRRYAFIRCTGGVTPRSMIPSTIPRYRIIQLQAQFPMPNTIQNLIPRHRYNADTTHLDAIGDESSAVQQALIRGMAVLKS